jgi:nitrite reductase (NO-forming)
VTFRLTNGGSLPHDFKVCASAKGGTANSCTGKVTKLVSPGRSTTLTYTFKARGTYEYLCTVPGHAAAGMKGDLRVA